MSIQCPLRLPPALHAELHLTESQALFLSDFHTNGECIVSQQDLTWEAPVWFLRCGDNFFLQTRPEVTCMSTSPHHSGQGICNRHARGWDAMQTGQYTRYLVPEYQRPHAVSILGLCSTYDLPIAAFGRLQYLQKMSTLVLNTSHRGRAKAIPRFSLKSKIVTVSSGVAGSTATLQVYCSKPAYPAKLRTRHRAHCTFLAFILPGNGRNTSVSG